MSDPTTNLVEFVDDEAAGVETDQDQNGVDDQVDGTEDDESEDPDSPSDQDEDEYEEVERGDKRYKIPKALKDELMMDADYRRKTQVHAEEVRRFEERAKAFEVASEESFEAAMEAKAVKTRLDDLNQLTDQDWSQLRAMDQQDGGDRCNRILRELTTLPQKLSAAEEKSKAMREKVIGEQSQIEIKQLEQGQAILARDIPGWGPELGAKLVSFVKTEFGVDESNPTHQKAFTDPALVKLAYAAFKAKETQRKDQTAKRAEQATKATPAAMVKGSAPKVGLHDGLSTKEWAERRNKQLASKGR